MTTKAVYLTWGETPRAYGIYRSQVAETLAHIARRHTDIEITLIAGLPMVHSGLVREKHQYPAELRRLREALGPVPLEICWIPVLQTHVHPKRQTFDRIFRGARLTLLPRLRRIDPDVVHCRSFLAAQIALTLRAQYGLRYRIAYDARSLWPEMQYHNRKDEQDLADFRAREANLVAQVDTVIGVNEPMRQHYADMGAQHAITNYIAANLSSPKALGDRDPGAPLRMVYAGALKEGGMQSPQMLFELTAAVRDLFGAVELTVYTTSPHDPLAARAESVLGSGVARFQAVHDQKQMPDLLAQHDLACNVYRRPKSDIDHMLCATGFSTKSAEYLAAGLPVLVSKYPAAVGHLLNEGQVGAVFDDTVPGYGLQKDQLSALLDPAVRRRAQSLAADKFARDVVADRFAAMYRTPGQP